MNNLAIYEEKLKSFRVQELQALLNAFSRNKIGKKDELLRRAMELLRTQSTSIQAAQKISELDLAVKRSTTMPQPPPLSSHNNPVQYGQAHVQGQQSVYMAQYAHGHGHGHGGAPNVSHFNNYGHMQQQQMPSMSRVQQLRISNLPFYHCQHTILNLTELPANPGGQRSTARRQFSFTVAEQFLNLLNYRGDPTLPRHEIQLRFFLLDVSVEQKDDFPLNCQVRLDNQPVNLPNIIPTNKPNAEQKRQSRPVNLTVYCQPPRGPSFRPGHNLDIEWTADKRAWAFGIYIVRHDSSAILLDRLIGNVSARRGYDQTRSAIIKLLNVIDGDGIEMETQRVSLLCPVSKTRMKIPIRPAHCKHLQCFDADTFLQMNEKKATWKCAVCDNGAHYSQLVIDSYFEEMIKSSGPHDTEAELLRDGTWRRVLPEAGGDNDSSDDERQPAAKKRTATAMSSAAAASADSEIITLSDSDDDNAPPCRRPAPLLTAPLLTAPMAAASSSSTLAMSMAMASPNPSDASDQSIIYIDPDEPELPQPMTASSSSSSSTSAIVPPVFNAIPTPPIPPTPLSSTGGNGTPTGSNGTPTGSNGTPTGASPVNPWMMGLGAYGMQLPPGPTNYYPYDVNNYGAMFQASTLPDYANNQVWQQQFQAWLNRQQGL